jgi:hypothetical protein
MTARESIPADRLLLAADSDLAVRAVTAALTHRGFRVMRSFDLRSAIDAHVGCECPHHGTAQCTCQFVVLLVYNEAPPPGDDDSLREGKTRGPVVLTAHSREGRTSLQVVHDAAARPDPHLTEIVMTALFEAALNLQVASRSEKVGAHAG